MAISEEFPKIASEAVKSGGLLFDRRVTRTITPGTLIDEKFMDPYESNFLLAVHPSSPSEALQQTAVGLEVTSNQTSQSPMFRSVGLAWLDLSTGEFFTQLTSMDRLPSAVARVGPREIILSDGLEVSLQRKTLEMLEPQHSLVTSHTADSANLPFSSWNSMLETDLSIALQSTFSVDEVVAGSILLDYTKNRLQGMDIKMQAPVRKQEIETMTIDKSSMRALEILKTSKESRDGGKGSLLHTVRRTVTKGGTRLLRDWIASPSMSLRVINDRLDLVSYLLDDRALREDLTNLLRQSYDSQRLVQKFSLGRGDAEDLLSLFRTIEVTNQVASRLDVQVLSSTDKRSFGGGNGIQQDPFRPLKRRLHLDAPNALASQIVNSIDEDGLVANRRTEEISNVNVPFIMQNALGDDVAVQDLAERSQIADQKVTQKSLPDHDPVEQDIWIFRRSANPTLEQLHYALTSLCQDRICLSSRLKQDLRAPSLTLRWTPGLGYICHVKGVKDVSATMKTDTSMQDVRTTKSTRSFHHADWSTLGSKIDQAKLRIRAEEQRMFRVLREQVIINVGALRLNAKVLDELDISCSFATFAEEQKLVRPVVNQGLNHNVIGGRHPCVTLGLEEQGRAFISNDCTVGDKERIWLITGPNMAGKSTFLRQNALISILAQVGSFVPADRAEIGLVDRIFTRIGSADDLFRDQSTFMVEMVETAAILKQATPQSFVIMDEIGRGTSPEDGIAIGFACLHHLYHTNRCRTLFATHFHALADMTRAFEHLACYCTDVVQGPEGSFSFMHRLQRGVNTSSHALKVARLAGIPETAIETARTVLQKLGAKPNGGE